MAKNKVGLPKPSASTAARRSERRRKKYEERLDYYTTVETMFMALMHYLVDEHHRAKLPRKRINMNALASVRAAFQAHGRITIPLPDDKYSDQKQASIRWFTEPDVDSATEADANASNDPITQNTLRAFERAERFYLDWRNDIIQRLNAQARVQPGPYKVVPGAYVMPGLVIRPKDTPKEAA